MILSKAEEKKLSIDILELKKDIFKMVYHAKSGHLGGSLSCINLIYLLYAKIMNINYKDPCWSERDFFILSKGHAAPALYAVLSKIGYINKEDLNTLRKFGSDLQGHPVKNKHLGIEVSTGSLGMGLSIGVGSALAAKLDESRKNIYVLLGDGEINEGAIWEAAMAANHFRLDNLIAIIDRNGTQIDGSTEEIMVLEPLVDKWKSFGWETIEVDGSNINEILQGIEKAKKIIKKPKVIISYVMKGADVSFMQDTRIYHGLAPNKEEYEAAINELDMIKEKLVEEIH
jgi:transketolase